MPSTIVHPRETSDSAAARSAKAAQDSVVTVAGVTISNALRAIPGEAGLTKLDIVRYYEAVAAWLLPDLASRPLSLVRCPGGDFDRCFFRRHPEDEAETGSAIPFVRVKNLHELIRSVQGGTIEFHGWGASLPRLDRPDRITLDLDPDPALPWKTFREAAELTRALLDQLELTWFLKTTGGVGLHFVVPLARHAGWDDVKDCARRFAQHLAGTLPTLFTATASKAKRKGRVYVDYLRNAEGASAVAAYSLRAKRGFPVAMPIPWEALNNDVRSDWFNLANVPQALASRKTDPWAGLANVRQSIASAARALGKASLSVSS